MLGVEVLVPREHNSHSLGGSVSASVKWDKLAATRPSGRNWNLRCESALGARNLGRKRAGTVARIWGQATGTASALPVHRPWAAGGIGKWDSPFCASNGRKERG